MSHKLGFWSVFALVTGSQIGSGIFMLPASLAPYGFFIPLGWLISGTGAIALALVFAKLCSWLPKTGGPHVYVQEAFGDTASFFTGWTYWTISWISTTVVVIASVGYLTPLIGNLSSTTMLISEIGLLLAITLLNCYSVSLAGRAEFFLTLLKIIPLIIVPLFAFGSFSSSNFMLDASVSQLSISQLLSRVTLLTMWGFIGVEAATTSASAVENPSKTIPRAVIAGTICTALLYLMNSFAITGIIPGNELMSSTAPYVDTVRIIFGGNWYLALSVIASIVCIGTLNAWMLTSGQIALGLAEDGFLPAIFKRKNRQGAPVVSLVLSMFGIISFLLATANKSFASQVLLIIDFSVTAFLFVYLACCFAFFKLLLQKKQPFSQKIMPMIYGFIALIFCVWIIYETPLQTSLIASLFTLAGVPLYMYVNRRFFFKNKK